MNFNNKYYKFVIVPNVPTYQKPIWYFYNYGQQIRKNDRKRIFRTTRISICSSRAVRFGNWEIQFTKIDYLKNMASLAWARLVNKESNKGSLDNTPRTVGKRSENDRYKRKIKRR